MSLERVEGLLRERTGLDPAAAGPGLIAHAVRRRAEQAGLEGDLEAYVRLLAASDEEFQELVEEVLVSETWFFRDELPFQFLAERARRVLSAGPAGRRFRVLSMPCASGEEPYSAAMALLDAGLSPSRIEVEGVDLGRAALARARRGVYSANAFRSRDLTFRARHFQLRPEGFVIDPEVARLVRFHHGNVVSPDLLDGAGPFDAVLCRNLLIYLDGPARARVVATIERLLGRSGLLLVGHAEQLGILDDGFVRVGPRGGFAFERREATRPVLPPLDPPPRSALPPAPRRPALERPPRVAAIGAPVPIATPRAGPERPAPAGPPRADRLAEAARLAGLGQHAEAARLCEEDMDLRGPSPAAYFLLGMTHQAAGDFRQAQSCLERAVYLDPRHEDALLSLALIAQRRGDLAAAELYRRRAGRAFQEDQRT